MQGLQAGHKLSFCLVRFPFKPHPRNASLRVMTGTQSANFGFVIDNRKCIGCHACTVACKSEHDVSIGVNRTHVKYIEKGSFPNSTREFSVHRCNHCEDAPCVEICPTMALFDRPDGIVDFDNARCIGCRSCMQACPYDALYIDPNSHTAAKCNYCAHRVEANYEPACVIVCPVEAIVSGDLNDPQSKISQTIATNEVKVRKAEKNTIPNVFYVETSEEILSPNAAPQTDSYVWSEQARGVGHFAKYAQDKLSEHDTDKLILQLAMEKQARSGNPQDQRVIADVMAHMQSDKAEQSRRVYDAPSKGVLWGWQVPAYIWTKAIASGLILVAYMVGLNGIEIAAGDQVKLHLASLFFLTATGALLVHDLDRPDRFLYVLFRPNWSSWLVKGAYIITGFGALSGLMLVAYYLNYSPPSWMNVLGIIFAVATAVYTAFLLAQAKARDLWASKLSPLHMLIHAVVAGSAALLFLAPSSQSHWSKALLISMALNLLLILMETYSKHETPDARLAAAKMTKGRYGKIFYLGLIGGAVIPIVLLIAPLGENATLLAAALSLAGIYMTEFVRIRTPQLISLI